MTAHLAINLEEAFLRSEVGDLIEIAGIEGRTVEEVLIIAARKYIAERKPPLVQMDLIPERQIVAASRPVPRG